MHGTKQYFVYVLTNKSHTLYIGVTNNLEKRMLQHKNKMIDGFTSKYNIDTLIYFEVCGDALGAIAREKELKGWRREKKLELIKSINPTFQEILL